MDAQGYDIYCLPVNSKIHCLIQFIGVHRVDRRSFRFRRLGDSARQGDCSKVVLTLPTKVPTETLMQCSLPQGYLRSWFEESHRASQESLDKLLPTIIRNPGAKCIFTANPQSSGDAFSQRFIVPYLSELEANGFL